MMLVEFQDIEGTYLAVIRHATNYEIGNITVSLRSNMHEERLGQVDDDVIARRWLHTVRISHSAIS